MERYRASLRPFVAWLVERRFVPHGPHEWDDLIVEWKNDTRPSKANFEACVAATEFCFPQFHGHLAWSHRVIAGWAIAHVARHTVPLGLGPACLIACHLAADGHGRLGLGIVVQRLLGLRPSEMLAIRGSDVALPEHRSAGEPIAIVGLGIRGGTKAKRAQAVILRDVVAIGLLRWMISETPADESIVGYTYEQYRRLLNKCERKLGLEIGWTPHSPRSGFASELIAAGVSFTEVRERGRWIADSSLRTYIDVVSAAGIAVSLRLGGLAEAIAFAQGRFLDFFPSADLYCHEARQHGRRGFVEGPGRGVSPSMGPSVGAEATGLPREIPPEEDGQPSARSLSRVSGVTETKFEARAGADEGRGAVGQGRSQGRGTSSTQKALVNGRLSQAPVAARSGRGGRGRSSR